MAQFEILYPRNCDTPTEQSDLDVIIEFIDDKVITLLDVIDVKLDLEDELSIKVDVLHAPLPEKAQKYLTIKNMVPVYERTWPETFTQNKRWG